MFNLTPAEKEKAMSIHKDSIVVDAHCDTLLEVVRGKRELGTKSASGHTDLIRMRTGGIGVQFFAAFIEEEYKPGRCLRRTMQMLDVFFRELDINQNQMRLIYHYKDIEKTVREGKIAAILAIEGGEFLEGDLSVLRLFYRLGVRSIGLTWNQRNEIADGIWERNSGGGLTVFGRRLVREMNNLGILIDLAHIAEKGFWDALELSEQPVVVTHANCQTLHKHPRNLNDQQLLALGKKGGLVGITFAPDFMARADANINHVLDHIDHVAKIAGTDSIGIGSDFDGIGVTPKGLEDGSKFMNLTLGLVERGYTKREIQGILGENFLRVLRKVLK